MISRCNTSENWHQEIRLIRHLGVASPGYLEGIYKDGEQQGEEER